MVGWRRTPRGRSLPGSSRGAWAAPRPGRVWAAQLGGLLSDLSGRRTHTTGGRAGGRGTMHDHSAAVPAGAAGRGCGWQELQAQVSAPERGRIPWVPRGGACAPCLPGSGSAGWPMAAEDPASFLSLGLPHLNDRNRT